MNKSRHHRIARTFGYLISAGCVTFFVFRVDWSLFIGYIKSAHLTLIVLSIILVVATYFLFALRWRLLLSFSPTPSIVQISSFLMLGYFANVILPMRAGDAVRVVLIRKSYGHGTARAVSSILLERILDVLVMLAFGAVVAFVAELPDTIVIFLRTAAVIAALGIAAVIIVTVRANSAAIALENMVTPFGAHLARTVAYHIRQFAEAINIIFPRDRGSATRVAAIVALSILGWANFAAAMIMCTAAFGVQPAIASGLLLMVVTNLGSAIPSSPASLGVYHALGILALSPWHVGLDLALSVATVSHAIAVGVQLLLGFLAMTLLGKNDGFSTIARLSDGSK